jgi:PHD/YefM family antitoxin component YafN of YafNO toxin-antitoxin module
MLYLLLRRKGTNNFFKEEKMQKALSQFDAGLEQVKEKLIIIAERLDSLQEGDPDIVVMTKIEWSVMAIADTIALLDARRVIFANEFGQ